MLLDETALKAKERKELPDSAFGIPSKRIFPLHDVNHVRLAIQMFSKCSKELKPELAENIRKKATEFNIKISKDSEINKYLKGE